MVGFHVFYGSTLDSRFSTKGRSAYGGRGNDRKRFQGFTLIELVIYIAILGTVLLSFTYFGLNVAGTRNKVNVVEEVQANGRIALAVLSQRIRDATGVNTSTSVFGANPGGGVLSLMMADVPTKNPTVFRLDAVSKALQIQEGTANAIFITSLQVQVTNLVFTNLTSTGSRANIRIELTISYNNPSGDPNFSYTASWTTTVGARQ